MSDFATFKSLTDLTQAELQTLHEHCFARNMDVNGHQMYMGRDTNTYSQTKFTFRGRQYHIFRHQLSLFLKLKQDPNFDMDSWDNSVATSHLCAKKKCITQEHLNLETLSINVERNHCVALGRCTGHSNQVDCLI